MKRLLTALVVIALSLPVVAISASNYTNTFTAGKYAGTINSVIPELNGTKATATVTKAGNNVTITVVGTGWKEVWTVNETTNKTTLVQTEYDVKTNKPTQTYSAIATTPTTGNSQKFNINCVDKAANKCDAGVDARNYWVIETTPNTINYVVYGVAGTDKGNPTAKVNKRHTFTFTKTN